MANEWTYAALASWETAALAADKPMLGAQAIPLAPTVSIWSNADEGGVGGKITGTDRTLAANPIYRAWDGYPHFETKHDATNDDAWYMVFDFGAGGIEFDFLALLGHNIGTIGGVTVTLELDNGSVAYPTAPNAPDGLFANVVSIPFSTTPTDDDRIIKLDLDHTSSSAVYRYTSVRFARIKFVKTAVNITPEIGEFFIARRYPLHDRPMNPFDPTSLHNETRKTRTEGGVSHKIIYHQGRFDLDFGLELAQTTYVNNLIAWFNAVRDTFIWIWKPNTVPDSWHLISREPDDLSLPSEGWIQRNAQIGGSEQGPERFFLSKE